MGLVLLTPKLELVWKLKFSWDPCHFNKIFGYLKKVSSPWVCLPLLPN